MRGIINKQTMQEEVKKAVEALQGGKTMLYPTDTIWGLGCDATNEEAVAQIYRIKQREDSKSCLVLVDSIDRVYDYIREMPDMALQILELSNKPLTIIYPGAWRLAPNLIAADGTIGIRVSSDPFCQEVIKRLRRPLVSTSANITGMPAPAHYGELSDEIKNQVDHIVNWRQDEGSPGTASGIIKVGLNGEVVVIRE